MQTLNYQFFFASKLLQNIEYKYDGDDDDDDERDNDVIKNRESVSFVIIKLNFCSLPYTYTYIITQFCYRSLPSILSRHCVGSI